MNNSPKTKGEKGQLISIGELAKWDIQIALPLSDNLPFDFILIYEGKLLKAQVKSSNRRTKANGSISFKLTTNNWHKKTERKYKEDEIDVIILCDYNNIYLLGRSDFLGRSSFDIRHECPANNQKRGVNLASEYLISQKRIKEIFNA